ncbi:MAG: 23S rRNA (adenine(2503)-C(2))-methyltransferase RlmN [Flavobacteriales bacterium]|nr:23S rRNA (adenine(2503)-C(2))-methyltransferase RlmN [Flavobacteriales bacterium]
MRYPAASLPRNIRSLDREELETWLQEHGYPSWRATQILEWLWGHQATSFEVMTNLPLTLRQKLQEQFVIHNLRIEKTVRSADGTVKAAYRLYDGKTIEGVLIPTPRRITACISSQAGCSLNCTFCATARLKMARNLGADEIFDQVALARQQAMEIYGRPLTNVVFMGMGEPLLNYRNVVRALELLHARFGLAMGAHRFTVSTAGIAKMIVRMADDHLPCKLALSLHAAIDEKRSALMPINQSNPLKELKEALQYYTARTRKVVTLEYLLLEGVNDSQADATALVRFARKFPSKVNLIEYNPVEGLPFRGSPPLRVNWFQAYLKEHGIVATLRRSRGRDIEAACGQLAGTLLQTTRTTE